MTESELKIVIIDDDADILFTLKEICEYCGYKALVASDGKEGYELVMAEKPQMVIVDYHMPGWDGMTTVKKIKSLNEKISILVLTVDEQQETADRFIEMGANDFSIKPIKAPDLISRIKMNMRILDIQQRMEDKKEQIYLEKGISAATLRMITDFMASASEDLNFEEISAGVSLAYQTVHRYVQYLVENEMIEVIPVYGRVGRPKNNYRLLK